MSAREKGVRMRGMMRPGSALVLVTALVLTWVLACGCNADTASNHRGFFEAAGATTHLNACTGCARFEIKDLAGVDHTYYSDRSAALRLGPSDIQHIDLMTHEGLSNGSRAWSLMIVLNESGREGLARLAQQASGALLVTVGPDIALGLVDRPVAREGNGVLVFALSDPNAVAELRSRVDPAHLSTTSASTTDRREACRVISRGDQRLLSRCVAVVDSSPEDWRTESLRLDDVERRMQKGEISEDEAVKLLEKSKAQSNRDLRPGSVGDEPLGPSSPSTRRESSSR